MAKIARKTQKVFAGSAANNGQFGSAKTGAKVTSLDLDILQNLGAFDTGWLDAVLSTDNLPTLEEMQALHYITTSQIGYLLQEGVAEYDTGTEYHINSIVKKVGTYELYGSKITPNTGNALPAAVDDANWQYLGDLATLVLAGASVDASPTVKGVVEEGTPAEVKAETATGGTGAPLFASPADMKHHEGIGKAWLNFDGTGTPAINDSYNVSSLTDNGVGDYTVNFTNSFANTDYNMSASACRSTGYASFTLCISYSDPLTGAPTSKTTSACRVLTSYGAATTAYDIKEINATFHGDI